MSWGRQIAPSASFLAVTPDDNNDLAHTSRGIYVGTGGDLVVIGASDGAEITFVGVPNGAYLPLAVKRVKTATTASDIVALL